MSDRPWYKRYGSDFITATLGMTLEEKGAYSIVLDLIYDRGGPIPDDPRYIAGVCGCSVRKWNSIRAKLIAARKLWATDGVISNSRADKELEKSAKTARKDAENDGKDREKNAENEAGFNKNKDLNSDSLAHASAVQKLEARDQIDDDHKPSSSSLSREGFEHIETALRQAAGLEHDPDPTLADVSPFMALLDTGLDFDRSIIPKVREIARKVKHRPRKPWPYYADAVANLIADERDRSARFDQRLNGPERKASIDELNRILAE